MNCNYCHTPIPSTEVPLVLSWGKKTPDMPDFLGKPIATAAHRSCDLIARGKSPLATTAKIVGPEVLRPQKVPASTGEPHRFVAKAVDGYIYKLVPANPRKEGTHGWSSFNLIKDGMSVESYLQAGGRKNDLAWDVDHKFVEVVDEVRKSVSPAKEVRQQKTATPPAAVPIKKAGQKPQTDVKKTNTKPSSKLAVVAKKKGKKR